MSNMNYYQFHIADWALHTSHLSVEEEGVYRRLLDFYYDTESPIPTETQPVIRRLRLNNHEDSVNQILAEFFVLEDDGWHNLRADSEIQAYNDKADRARENGKKGGRPKKNKSLQSDKPTETQPVNYRNPEKTGSKANHKPLTINHSKPDGKPSGPVGIKTFLANCKKNSEQPIKPDDPIFNYTEDAGIPHDFVRLCWLEFVERNMASGKRQKDWRAAFRNCIRGNWYKLWWLDGNEYKLTTTGKQAEIKHRNTGRAA